MDLKTRLSYYRSSGNNQENKPTQPAPSSLKSLNPKQIDSQAEILFPERPVVKISKSVPAAFRDKYLSLPNLTLHKFPKIRAEQLLFFDLETTGLSGGTGSFAFLLGFGFIRDGQFCTEQFFLPDFGHEPDLFEYLNGQYRDFKALVSFNGKSFDSPLLRTRFSLNRIIPFFSDWQHLDVFHLSRRIWKDSFASCSLQSLEKELFRMERKDDVPGELIPAVYFDFLQTGQTEAVRKVISHNYLDLRTTQFLVNELSAIDNKAGWDKLDSGALLRLAVLAGQINRTDWLEEISDICRKKESSRCQPIEWMLSLTSRRNGDFETAAALWRKLSEDTEYALPARIELAKFYEHRIKDYRLALSFTETALRHIEVKLELGEKAQELLDIHGNLMIRRRRILQKSA